MKKILLFSQKGGTGKTTLADNIAFAFEAAGVPIAFYDTDPQGGALHETKEPDGAQVAIIDTPGTLTRETRDMIEDADLIVLPTRASRLDMPALERARVMIEETAPNTPVIIVLNGYNRWSNAAGYKAYLETKPRSAERVIVLSQSEMIPQAAFSGISVLKHAPRSTPAAQIRDIVQTIKTALGMEGSE